MFDSFHFLAPYWLLLFPCVLVLSFWLRKRQLNRSHWSEVCDPELLPFLEQKQEIRANVWLPVGLVIACLLLSIAAAQPVWKQQPQPVFKQGDAVVIALDLSASMNATDLKPSRLQRARFKIEDLLSQLPDAQVALLVYAADAYSVTPLTEDADTILAQLPAMSPEIMPLQGSRADRALQKADQLLSQAGIAKGNILFVSDEVSPAQIASDATRLRAQGRQISILAVGTEQGAPIETDHGLMKDSQGRVIVAKTQIGLIKEAAHLGGGFAALITADDQDLHYLVQHFQKNDKAPAVLSEKVKRWIAEGPWFVLLALPLLLPLFRRGVLALLLPTVLLFGGGHSTEVEASLWQDLWKTSDQQANELYQSGAKGEAAEQFSDPRWKQLSHYENGDYEKAQSALASPETAADWYNHGNILARQGQLDNALASYDKALAQQPNFKNAQHNRHLVEQLLKQQEQQKQSQPSDQAGEKGDSQDPQGQGNKDQQSQNQNKAGEENKNESSSGGESEQRDTQNSESQQADSTNNKPPKRTDSKQTGSSNGDRQDSTPSTAEPQKEGLSEQEKQLANELKRELDAQKESMASSVTENTEEKPQSQETIGSTSSGERHQPLDEQQEARQQMLNRIEDDPAGLWRRKFLYQYRQQAEGQNAEDKTW